VQSKLQSAAGFAATAILNAVSSAINNIETAVNSLILRNYTIRTDYLCVRLDNSINCLHLLLNNSYLISRVLLKLLTKLLLNV
jgi:hypothetical protein